MKAKLNTLIKPLLVLSGLFLFLLLTNPKDLPLIGLLVPFLALGVGIYMLIRYWQNPSNDKNKPTSRIPAFLVTFTVIILLLLSSLHQLTWKDAALVLVFAVIFLWYAKRMNL